MVPKKYYGELDILKITWKNSSLYLFHIEYVLRKYMLFQFNIQVESANHLWYTEVCSTQEGVTKSTYPLDIFDSDLLCKENLSTNFLFESSWGRQKKNTFFLRVALQAKVAQNTAYFIPYSTTFVW